MNALTFVKSAEQTNFPISTTLGTGLYVNTQTKSPIQLNRTPIQGRISNGPSHGSMNLFYTTSATDKSIYGITCAHVLPKVYEHRKILFRPAGSTQKSIQGVKHLGNKTTHFTDLSIIKFSYGEMNSSFSLAKLPHDHTKKLDDTHRDLKLFGLGSNAILGRGITTNNIITHQGKILNNLISLNQIGNKGDSGTSIITYSNGQPLCLGQLCLISNQRTYITCFQETLKHLVNITNVHSFYYLIQNNLT